MNDNWYEIKNIEKIDSPALVVYKDRVIRNINTAIAMVGDVARLRPHVKTHKSPDVTKLMIDAGITKFKCATIAEAEMLALSGAPDVLLAYQPVGPKSERFISLVKKYPGTNFSCLADNSSSVKEISGAAEKNDTIVPVYIDVNVGMNRTGIPPAGVMDLYKECGSLKNIIVKGLHVYDGHLRNADFKLRREECNKTFEQVTVLIEKLKKNGFDPIVIAGGSPTFSIHCNRKNVECSPGTFVYWDRSYQVNCVEQDFIPAAIVMARVISLPSENRMCIDLGHKSIASENDLQSRVYFLNAPELKFVGHSEEHLVAEVSRGHAFKPGDILYGLPFHICPTVALYERALVVENKNVNGEWKNTARDRKLTI